MSTVLYDVLLAVTLFINIGINLNPGFRNVPPTMDKSPLDNNKKLKKL